MAPDIRDKSSHPLKRYAFAVLMISATLLLRYWLGVGINPSSLFTLLYGAIMISAWYGGIGPGILATLLGALAARLCQDPHHPFVLASVTLQIRYGLFVLIGIMISLFYERLHRAKKKAEVYARSLEASETRYRRIVETAHEGMWVIKPEAERILFVNRRMAEMVGCSVEEVLSQSWVEFVFEEDRDEGRRILESAQTSVQEQVEFRFRCKDGSALWVRININPLHDEHGRFLGVLGMVSDMTGSKKAEQEILALNEELQRRVTEFETLLNVIPMGIMIARDPECHNIAVNPYLASLLRLPPDINVSVSIPNPLRLPYKICQNGRPLRFDEDMPMRQVIRNRAELRGLELDFLGEDGRELKFMGNISPLFDPAGQTRGAIGALLDVTSRVEAEEALRRSEERLRVSWDLSLDGFIILQSVRGAEGQIVDFKFEYVNPMAAQILQSTPQDLEGERLLECYPGNKSIGLFDSYVQVVETGQPHDVEINYDADWISCWLRNMAVKLGDGVAVSFSDISGRKQTEDELRESHRRANSILESVSDMFIALDRYWRFTYVNRKAEEFIGKSRDELIGRILWTVYPESLVMTYYQEARRAVTENVAVHLERYEPLKGVWLECSMYPSSAGVSIYFRDVTERKRGEETLYFLSKASDALASSLDYQETLENVARLVTPSMADFCFIDLLGHDGAIERLAMAHADSDKERLAGQTRRHAQGGERLFGVSQVLQTGEPLLIPDLADDSSCLLLAEEEGQAVCRELGIKSWMTVPLVARGRTLGAISFAATHPAKRFSGKDLPLAEELARRAAMAVDNARLYHEVQEADRRKDEFLAMLAHELRNPLAPLHISVELIAMREGSNPLLVREIGTMRRQIQRLTRMIDDLLDVSRITQGKITLKREPVDLLTIIRLGTETARPAIDGRSHRLMLTLPTSPVWVEVDPTRLEQVIVNLLNNAAKYSNPGSRIWLSVELEAEEDEGFLSGGMALIRVKDEGIGISAEMLPRVFDLFAQADQSLDRTQGGLGIGLTLVRNLVELHGGSVSIESGGLGQGSEFAVRLPITWSPNVRKSPTDELQVMSPETFAPPDEPASAPPVHKILIVDDNVDAALSLGELLQLWGHIVDLAYDGPSGIEKATEMHPDIVLLDIGLPGMNGYEVARRLRRIAALQQVVVVALTGYGQAEDHRRAKEAGCDLHFTKPVNLTALMEVLDLGPGD